MAISAVASLVLAGGAVSGVVASATTRPGAAVAAGGAAPAAHTLSLSNGSTLSWNDGGTARVTDKAGVSKVLPMPRSAGGSGLGETYGPSQLALATRATASPFELGSKATQATAAQIGPMNTGPVTFPQANRKAMQLKSTAAPTAPVTSG